VDDRIYILKSGRIVLKSRDIETGQNINDLIQTGEFFGVKSALGHLPREEDALVLSDAQVVQFSVPEFEQMAMSNTRIIIKMLKVFSNQLRRIHSKVSSMLNQEDQVDPAEGLHHSASFYFRNRQYEHARYIWGRYLELYPGGAHAEEARRNLERAKQSSQASSGKSSGAAGERSGERSDRKQDVSQQYFAAETDFANEKYDRAIEGFKSVVEAGGQGEYKTKAEVEIGRVYYEKEDYTATIRHFSKLIKDAPRHPRMAELLYYIGLSYGKTGQGSKAKTVLNKARSGAENEPVLKRKIDRAIAQVET
jgi:CRP-like cAMP-binding protein